MLTHAAIALNRIWALWMPVTFHNVHNFRFAWLVVMGIWLAAHVIGVPPTIADIVISHRPTIISQCFFHEAGEDSYKTAALSINEILNVICFVVIVAAFPLVMWKQKVRAVWKKQITIRLKIQSTDSSTERQSRVLMGILTASILICWGPVIGYLALAAIADYDNLMVVQVLTILFNCQSIADPILIILALPVWRECVNEIVGECLTLRD
ncbi:uncharacterized protein LOC129586449 [Paramacrobiotus metropolitanus]|uniref:uncharacterized protein LOC129586449 n=1 Tax=Paramacrobiotus metropolitanus TaxID=2943436 RepID=UPI002446413E|nr:uncharacterized protein LOC129586449 [Paramacrobiotus metropolitanus]